MKPETIRKRLGLMEVRLQRDLDRLERLFPIPTWDGAAYATEAVRNLATAVAYLQMLQSKSDYGVEQEVKFHQPRICNCCIPAPAEPQFCHCDDGLVVTNGERHSG